MLVPVGTAAASHLFGGAMRPRALGVVGALTFLGMAAGPVVGAAIIGSVHPEAALAAAGAGDAAISVLTPAWRWVFYLNIPIGLIALTLAWAASPDWESPRRPGRVDIVGAAWFGFALVAGLIGLTLIGTTEIAGTAIDPRVVTAGLLGARGRRHADLRRPRASGRGPVPRPPAVPQRPVQRRGARVAADRLRLRDRDHRWRRLRRPRALRRTRTSSAWRSGRWPARPRSGRSCPGSSSGSCRSVSSRWCGLVLSIGALLAMSRWTSTVSLETVAIGLGAFGLGFGLTVTPRSTAAVEAAGRRAFGTASAVVTVARMIGMAVGLAILTAYGSTTIDRLYVEVYASPDAYQQFIPEALRDRPLRDPLVVGALEDWASREAAAIMVGLFIVAAGVSAVAIPPSLTLGGSRGTRTRMLDDAPAAKDATEAAAAGGSDADGLDAPEPGLAL